MGKFSDAVTNNMAYNFHKHDSEDYFDPDSQLKEDWTTRVRRHWAGLGGGEHYYSNNETWDWNAEGYNSWQYGPLFGEGIGGKYVGRLTPKGDAWADYYFGSHTPEGHRFKMSDEFWRDAWPDAKDWHQNKASATDYLGPSKTSQVANVNRFGESFQDRETRLKDASTGLEGKYWQKDFGNPASPEYDRFGAMYTDPQTGEWADQDALARFISTEFGASNFAKSDLGEGYAGSDEYAETEGLAATRTGKTGSLWAPPEELGGADTEGIEAFEHRIGGATGEGGLVGYLSDPENVPYEYVGEGTPEGIDWQATLAQGSRKQAVKDAVDTYFTGVGQPQGVTWDKYNPGTFMSDWYDTGLSQYTEAEQAGVAADTAERLAQEAQDKVTQAELAKSGAGKGTRDEMLGHLLEGQERQYTSGLARMGQSPAQRAGIEGTLQGGRKELLGSRQSMISAQDAATRAESDAAIKAALAENAMEGLLPVHTSLRDALGEAKSDWGSLHQGDALGWDEELWDMIEGGYS